MFVMRELVKVCHRLVIRELVKQVFVMREPSNQIWVVRNHFLICLNRSSSEPSNQCSTGLFYRSVIQASRSR